MATDRCCLDYPKQRGIKVATEPCLLRYPEHNGRMQIKDHGPWLLRKMLVGDIPSQKDVRCVAWCVPSTLTFLQPKPPDHQSFAPIREVSRYSSDALQYTVTQCIAM